MRLSDLVTTRTQLDLSVLLVDDSTYFGDLFAHVVSWRGDLYLEDGLHRALRAALSTHGDAILHARIHVIADSELGRAEATEQPAPARAGSAPARP